MLTDKQTRELCASMGLDDDRQERVIRDLMADCRKEVELERARVPDKVWALEIQLMRERTNG